ncbi:hypothetical protein BDA99DRAFT_556206 [Phascolomyces articulosus]|uniref:Uncharacterized protein n=1 Tax=Phascolomyces articulosus TaxID=60185 RepID=A0AAD5PK72_9FUNG|nr:hypothetical protein BDA99DRAFT_556206 [Phascolomyces articulosus]
MSEQNSLNLSVEKYQLFVRKAGRLSAEEQHELVSCTEVEELFGGKSVKLYSLPKTRNTWTQFASEERKKLKSLCVGQMAQEMVEILRNDLEKLKDLTGLESFAGLDLMSFVEPNGNYAVWEQRAMQAVISMLLLELPRLFTCSTIPVLDNTTHMYSLHNNNNHQRKYQNRHRSLPPPPSSQAISNRDQRHSWSRKPQLQEIPEEYYHYQRRQQQQQKKQVVHEGEPLLETTQYILNEIKLLGDDVIEAEARADKFQRHYHETLKN